MKKVAYISDSIYLNHTQGLFHPESPERLEAINSAIKSLHNNLLLLSPLTVPSTIVRLVHSKFHIDNIYNASNNSLAIDTICSKDSYDIAIGAIGAGIRAVDGINRGEFDRAFCAVRPPGHHASSNKGMGFCIFNNCAITAKYAQFNGYKRVMIVDFDVHHGNGTQDTFYRDNSVFYFSSHQALAYPNTGSEDEIGEGKGKGYTTNYLMMPNSGDEELLDIYKNELPKAFKFFKPDILLVSAGYDLHESDPLAMLDVTTDGISQMVRLILDQSNIPAIFILEGGYDPISLGKNVKVTLEQMMMK
ncbi:MAG: histone deacetylase [Sulfurovum sp.]|nr:histone deacetylase [Sulfurovaceae bacterium]